MRWLYLLLSLFLLVPVDVVYASNAAIYSPEAISGTFELVQNVDFKKQIEKKRDNVHTYIIKYDFDLKGSKVTLPPNTVLLFSGGRLENGIIVGGYNSIMSPQYLIFGENLKVEGKWAVDAGYPEWFGAKGGTKTDSRPAIQRCLNAFKRTVLSGEEYYVNSYTDTAKRICIDVPKYHTLEGHSSNAQHLQKTIVLSKNINPLICCRVNTFSVINNIDIVGNNTNYKNGEDVGVGSDKNEDVGHVSLNNLKVRFFSTGYNLQTYITSLDNCFAVNCTRGFWLHGESGSNRNTGLNMRHCAAYNTKKIAFQIENLTYSIISNCYGDRNGYIVENTTNEEIYPFYYCRNLTQVTFVSCGAEMAGALMDASNCHLIIDGFRAIVEPNKVGKWIAYFQLGHYSLRNISVASYSGSTNIKTPIFAFSDCSATVENVTLFGEELSAKNCSISKTANVSADWSLYRLRGAKSERPKIKNSSLYKGFMYFDETLNKPIWWDGSKWIDSNGKTC